MLEGINNGWGLIKESVKVFNHHPKLIVPLLVTWALYAPITLVMKFWIEWDSYSQWQALLLILGFIFIFSFLLSISCSMLLELIQQLESSRKMSISVAFKDTFIQNTLRILPLVFVWTIIWFILLVIQALLSKSKKSEKESFSAENAAKTLAGYEKISLSKAFFTALQKGVRMIVFLILPAMAWENFSFVQSVKRGIAVFKANIVSFSAGFMLTEFASLILFLPPFVLLSISNDMKIPLPDFVWFLTIMYIAFAWSYSIYLEQMFAAQLYLWHMKWENEVIKAENEGRKIPLMRDIPKPSVLDEVGEFANAYVQ